MNVSGMSVECQGTSNLNLSLTLVDVKLVIKTWVVAHKILETAQSPNSSFPFLFDFGLGLGTWDLDSALSIICLFQTY